MNAEYWIKKLKLLEHPEGGYYSETYRSDEELDSLPKRFNGKRSVSTAIYFLLKCDQFSTLHTIKSDEMWHFYAGKPLTIHQIEQSGSYSSFTLGNNPEKGEVFQAVVPAGVWFGASVNANDGYALVGCTVAPGFDFQDFELGKQAELLATFPQHETIIKKLTHN